MKLAQSADFVRVCRAGSAPKHQGLKATLSRSLQILHLAVAHVQNRLRWHTQLFRRLLVDDPRRLSETNLAGDGNGIEIIVKLEHAQKRAQAFVPIRNNS